MDPADAQRLAAELEVEMMADMYSRMTQCCQKKCISTHYGSGDLEKGESVCIDRCVAKYLDIHEKIGKQLTQISKNDEEAMNAVTNTPVAKTP